MDAVAGRRGEPVAHRRCARARRRSRGEHASCPGKKSRAPLLLTQADDEAEAADEGDDGSENASSSKSMARITSPRWVCAQVLNALRKVDEPHKNAGCECAISFCSEENPSASLTPEIFRSYLDDENYPYGVLTRWIEMRPDAEVIFDDDRQHASYDTTLIDKDGSERVVTMRLSKSNEGAWLVDSVWCPE